MGSKEFLKVSKPPVDRIDSLGDEFSDFLRNYSEVSSRRKEDLALKFDDKLLCEFLRLPQNFFNKSLHFLCTMASEGVGGKHVNLGAFSK